MRMFPLILVFTLLAAAIGYALAADNRSAPAQPLHSAIVPPLVL